uniref:Uncharacterized protein n=1 Tax=Pararge aegeria TaxID=116150 RepID=S4PJK3_9NEOP
MAAKLYMVAIVIAYFILSGTCTFLPICGSSVPRRPSGNGQGPTINVNPVNNAKSSSSSNPSTIQDARQDTGSPGYGIPPYQVW